MTNTEQFLILLGTDNDAKPRAARFKYEDEAGVRKLAAIKGFRIGHAKTDEAIALVLKLVDGKIFSSGKGLVPLVNPDTFAKLQQILEIEEAPGPSPPTTKAKASLAPKGADASPWADIVVGRIVLCPNAEKGKDRSWWETTVTAISKDGKTLTVRWTHYPTVKPFAVKRTAVALISAKA